MLRFDPVVLFWLGIDITISLLWLLLPIGFASRWVAGFSGVVVGYGYGGFWKLYGLGNFMGVASAQGTRGREVTAFGTCWGSKLVSTADTAWFTVAIMPSVAIVLAVQTLRYILLVCYGGFDFYFGVKKWSLMKKHLCCLTQVPGRRKTRACIQPCSVRYRKLKWNPIRWTACEPSSCVFTRKLERRRNLQVGEREREN